MARTLPPDQKRIGEEAVRRGLVAAVVMEAAAREWAAQDGEEPLPDYLVRREVLRREQVVELAAAIAAEGPENAPVVETAAEGARAPHPSEVIQGYRILERLGRGGMGSVYRAEHALLRRPTAVKMLSPERAGRDSIARFEREVKLTARLTHPNTVAIYDYGRTRDGLFYYAMEFLDGLSLEELVKQFGPQPPGRVIHILMQATGALAEAHALGLIHRDIKPANVLFCERGGTPDVVKLVDFGLVKNLEPEPGPALTHTNAITGTPQYLAPETITDPAGIDHRVDLYGLGGVAYYLLTGRPPFEGSSVLEIVGHHLHTPVTPPSRVVRSSIPPDLEALILSCLAKKPAERPASAQGLHDTLAECARSSPWNLGEARAFWQNMRRDSTVRIRTSDRPSA